MQTKRLKLTQLEPNLGQIEGLPINPRQWTQGDVDKIAKSLKETPELFEARPLLVIEHEGKYVILGGNLRYEGCKKNGAEDAPCYVFPKDTPIGKLKEIAIKDNGSFGAWDFDALANEWDNLPLSDWGVPVWDVEEEVEKVQKEEDKAAQVPFTEILGEAHNFVVLYFDNEVDWLQAQTLFDIKPVQAMPTRKDGTSTESFKDRVGVGRVLNGAKAIQSILTNKDK